MRSASGCVMRWRRNEHEFKAHTTAAERALYVQDALTVDERERLEAHIISCPSCHAEVLAEARIEVALHKICSHPADKTDLAPHASPWPVESTRQLSVHSARAGRMRLAIMALPAAAALALLLRFSLTPMPPHGSITEGPQQLDRRRLWSPSGLRLL